MNIFIPKCENKQPIQTPVHCCAVNFQTVKRKQMGKTCTEEKKKIFVGSIQLCSFIVVVFKYCRCTHFVIVYVL